MIDHVIKAIALSLDNGEKVYVGLNSIPAILGAFMARDFYGKTIRILGVAEADNPSEIKITPSTGNPFYVNETPILPTVESFDLAQKGKLDVMFLGPAQIDEETNVNLSVIGDYSKPKVRLPGGAATAYILPLVKKAILWNLKHSKSTLVKRVDFVTGSAKFSTNKVIVVTDLGVLEYSREDKKWYVKYVYPWSNFAKIVENTAFQVYNAIQGVIDVNEEEKNFITKLDPDDLRSSLEY
ncbi:CoA-transferase subunit beta [Acidianus ambivalens]|uniref:CoA-transferase subunit beta n=1 Tax=Acidianus ambivalens TaxID=2283 RepID=A0A650CXZ7_ACIAM|nr:CoA-transferase [Acidianus ambivalens]MQL54919.1 CoA-transferase subunit beta [Acidianus ambivalens]QGR22703.1 CoA-transferase subunit beta [Acidianus ambivalens]